jgi:hypothetical protein
VSTVLRNDGVAHAILRENGRWVRQQSKYSQTDKESREKKAGQSLHVSFPRFADASLF